MRSPFGSFGENLKVKLTDSALDVTSGSRLMTLLRRRTEPSPRKAISIGFVTTNGCKVCYVKKMKNLLDVTFFLAHRWRGCSSRSRGCCNGCGGDKNLSWIDTLPLPGKFNAFLSPAKGTHHVYIDDHLLGMQNKPLEPFGMWMDIVDDVTELFFSPWSERVKNTDQLDTSAEVDGILGPSNSLDGSSTYLWSSNL